ncbi:hypothetical protein [Rhizobium halophytocola]|uniref:Uncharacterized protein n=1 Tax=Rhizobium halophytocola TaxID=735519 RepID=A0ABS4E3R3_9HYPH|nr:hypothetical protein [Rhizobium halophytocola]MBP1852573.1 hypothetical protein [Rhizobium halophytocola]
MPQSNDTPVTRVYYEPENVHLMETPESIDRLAREMRATSGTDLPHAYFIEQVKLKLAAGQAGDTDAGEAFKRRRDRNLAAPTSSSLFQSWAMPDNG